MLTPAFVLMSALTNLAIQPAAPLDAARHEPTQIVGEVTLDLVIRLDDELADALQSDALDAVTRALGQQRILTRPTAGTSVTLVIGWTADQEGLMLAYAIDDASGKAPRFEHISKCRMCGTAELRAQIEVDVAELGPTLRRRVLASEASDASPPLPSPQATAAPLPPQRTLGALGIGGAVVTSIGAASLVVGGVFLGIGRQVEPVQDNLESARVRDFRPSGYALVGIGCAAIVSGVVMLAVDRARARRSSRKVAVRPSLGGAAIAMRW